MRKVYRYLGQVLIKVIIYILKPFQITKIMELLYTSNWVWFAFLSLLPEELVSGSVLNLFRQYLPGALTSIMLVFLATTSVLSLLQNIIVLRRIILLTNLTIVLLLSSRVLFQIPINSSSGYLLILATLTMLSYWRMDRK